ncbi:hypothetical protein SRHO_G00274870 [Serrasalmus rhombeus]
MFSRLERERETPEEIKAGEKWDRGAKANSRFLHNVQQQSCWGADPFSQLQQGHSEVEVGVYGERAESTCCERRLTVAKLVRTDYSGLRTPFLKRLNTYGGAKVGGGRVIHQALLKNSRSTESCPFL